MKTLSEMIREWLAARKEGSSQGKGSPQPVEENRPIEKQTNLLTTKQNKDETENHESARNSGMDNSDAGQNSGIGEEQKPNDSDTTGSGTGADDIRGGEGNIGCDDVEGDDRFVDKDEGEGKEEEQRVDPLDLPEVKEALRVAYHEGEIAGRNAVIEERYFPKNDDGLPHFRGRGSKPVNSSDIFSMAREA